MMRCFKAAHFGVTLGMALLGGLAMTDQPADARAAIARGPYDGVWGGSQIILEMNPYGGHVELGCASGTITGPIKLAKDGSFTARGTYEAHHGGPERVEESAKSAAPARYRGQIRDGMMMLFITPAGAKNPDHYMLEKGARKKLIRCL
jgi:hypothetical protein